MSLFTAPEFWARPKKNLIAWLLTPIALLWALCAILRMKKAPENRMHCPVICVGNLNIGGSGKTPLVTMLIRELKTIGYHPGVILRGYGRKTKKPVVVSVSDTAETVGDEALYHLASAPTAVGANRFEAANLLLKSHPDINVLVMDDGLQNTSLYQDIRICAINALKGLGNGAVLPAGPLRAPITPFLKTIDAIFISRTLGEHEHKLKADTTNIDVITFTRTPTEQAKALKGLDVIAFSAIAHPDGFEKLLRSTGARIIQHHQFPDHHQFTEAEAKALLQEAQHRSATLVTTQKDKARLANQTGAKATLFAIINTLDLSVEPDDRAALHAFLKARLSGA